MSPNPVSFSFGSTRPARGIGLNSRTAKYHLSFVPRPSAVPSKGAVLTYSTKTAAAQHFLHFACNPPVGRSKDSNHTEINKQVGTVEQRPLALARGNFKRHRILLQFLPRQHELSLFGQPVRFGYRRRHCVSHTFCFITSLVHGARDVMVLYLEPLERWLPNGTTLTAPFHTTERMLSFCIARGMKRKSAVNKQGKGSIYVWCIVHAAAMNAARDAMKRGNVFTIVH